MTQHTKSRNLMLNSFRVISSQSFKVFLVFRLYGVRYEKKIHVLFYFIRPPLCVGKVTLSEIDRGPTPYGCPDNLFAKYTCQDAKKVSLLKI